MPTITTADGTEIFYKDWGQGQPIVFSHGWPLSADDWDTQMMFFLLRGYRVVASDRRGHGRSEQTDGGHDMDHYADDLAAVVEHLDLHDAIHVGHSTGGGEVTRYIARHGESRVARAVLISSVPPLMVKTDANPGGLPKDVFDGLQAQTAEHRSEFYRDFASGPFYGYNRPGAKPSEAIIQNWWRQGMMGGAKDRLHRGPEEDLGAGAGHARRGRPGRALRRCRATVGQAGPERDTEELSRLPPRHAHHRIRHHQQRPAGLAEELTSRVGWLPG
jgi:non-heme chloroperoxidase